MEDGLRKTVEGKDETEGGWAFSSSMDALSRGGVGRLPSSQRLLQAESLSLFAEAVHLILSRWTALRLAVHNEWGGGNSRQKSEQLVQDLVSWFISSNAPIHIDELEMMLDEKMVLCFNTEIEDGSVEEVAEQLMTIHEDCLEGNYDSLIDRHADGSSDEEYEPALDDELDPL
ncbi:Pre-rRNA-processing TSR2-like protein [Nymphaea thermarum]|nr:Pre-rRNA-processing TSR2-like protein [Nymphaea thermarum]